MRPASRAHRSSAAASARGVLPLLPALLILVLVGCTGIVQAGQGWGLGPGQLSAGAQATGRFGGALMPATGRARAGPLARCTPRFHSVAQIPQVPGW